MWKMFDTDFYSLVSDRPPLGHSTVETNSYSHRHHVYGTTILIYTNIQDLRTRTEGEKTVVFSFVSNTSNFFFFFFCAASNLESYLNLKIILFPTVYYVYVGKTYIV